MAVLKIKETMMKKFLLLLVIVACTAQTDKPMYVVEHVDFEHRIYHVRLRDDLVSGSDGACHTAGIIINFILERDPAWKVWVTNDWVPSKYNPIDLDWSRELAKGY